MPNEPGDRPTKAEFARHCQDQLRDLRTFAEELTEEDWDRPVLCEGWRVRDVYAHLLAGRLIGPVKAAAGIARSRGSMDRFADEASRALADELGTEDLVARFAEETSRWPERGIAGMEAPRAKLADNLTHELDIRWAIDRRRDLPEERLAAALTGSVLTTRLWGNAARTKGLRFRATDLDWASGAGPEVAGPGQALLLAINGRPAGLAELTGEGVALLRSRLRA